MCPSLFDTDQTQEARSPRWLQFQRNSPVIVRLINEENCGDKAESSFNSVHPESPCPLLCADNEGREKGSEVWAQNDETRPDVDFPSSFMKLEDGQHCGRLQSVEPKWDLRRTYH